MSAPIAGNRLVLAGAVLYLLEWIAIIAAGVSVPVGAAAGAHDVTAAYAGHADAIGWSAGWFCVVEVGRILVMVGLRVALPQPGRLRPLLDLAVVAMAVSVAIEIVVYGVTAGGAWSLANGGSPTAVRVLDAVSYQLNETIYGPLGVSMLCAGWVMWKSGAFHRALPVLALVAGALFTLLALAFVAPRYSAIAQTLEAGALLAWIWMVWTGVVVWRARSGAVVPGAEDRPHDPAVVA
jgi:hypothetical protein